MCPNYAEKLTTIFVTESCTFKQVRIGREIAKTSAKFNT